MATTSDQTAPEEGLTVSEHASYSVLAWLGPRLPKQYVNMVYSKWMKSLRYGNDYFKLAESGPYFSAYQRYIASVLCRPECIVRTAVLSDDHDVCLGFSVSEPKTLHYVHVQKDNRKQGIARSLVPFAPKVITHLTKAGMILWAQKIPNAVFNPWG